MAGVDQRGMPGQAMLVFGHHRVVHQQDGILAGDADQHQQANQGRQRQHVAGDQQRTKCTGRAQRYGAQNGQRLHRVTEQQQQHHVDADDPGHHRQHEAGKQFDKDFRIAGVDDRHPRRQRFHRRQLLHLRHHIAQRAAIEFGGQGDVALALVAADHRRPTTITKGGHRRQWHRPARARDAQLAQ